jgi:hypothetical protein
MDPDGLREYGGADVEALGVPTWRGTDEELPPCPNCGAKVVQVQVKVRTPLITGGVGKCTYFGCPACPWASPSVTTTLKADPSEV